jgi:sporadic carbohydrate cluster protein (TIGR04323 family)
MANKLGYCGYVTSRGFGGYRIPVPVQSLVLRDYCQRHKFVYVLPSNENIFPHSYMVLEGLIDALSKYEGVVMCSMHMLPEKPSRRREICSQIINQGAVLHLALEERAIRTNDDIDKLEELLSFYRLTQLTTPPETSSLLTPDE